MKWRLVVGVILSILLFQNCTSKNSSSDETPPTAATPPNSGFGTDPNPNQSPSRLTFSGIGSKGIFDASLEKSDSNRVWMTFSAVDPSPLWPVENYHSVSTHLAYSDDGGSSWIYSKKLNALKDVNISALSYPLNTGTWHGETSTLIYEPSAPTNQRWKLMWHRYLLINYANVTAIPDYHGRRFEHGWIALKQADSPENLDTAAEIKLFGASGYSSENNNINGITKPTVGGAPLINLHLLHSDLNSCVLFTEPSLLVAENKVFLFIGCGAAQTVSSQEDIKGILLSCNSPCDFTSQSSWTYLGTIINRSMAEAMGYKRFNGGEIFKGSDGYYLGISPVSDSPYVDSYNGCYFFKFSNLVTGQLEKSGSLPKVVKTYNGESNSFNGACAYERFSNQGGMIHSQLVPTTTEKFQLFKTFLNF